MKITRLSSTEVANISVLPFEKKQPALEAIEEPAVRWGYSPVEDGLPKLLLAESGLFGHLPSGDDDELIRQIERACNKGAKQIAANGAVARAIVAWRNENSVRGRIVAPEPLRMSVDTLHYCADVAAVVGGKAYILNLDCRSSMVQTALGKEFMKSLIHHTARIGDLRDAGVAILRTPKVKEGLRKGYFEILEGEPRFSMDEILKMVTETYSVWESILRARRVGGKGKEA